MTKLLASLLVASVLALTLAACSSLETFGISQPVRPSPTPCVTATPATGQTAEAGSAIAAPAGRTAPGSGSPEVQQPASPSELATREALLEQRNRPVQVPTAEQSNAPALPVCPTPTPAK